MQRFLPLFVGAAFLALAQAAHADGIYELSTRNTNSGAVNVNTILVKGGKFRMGIIALDDRSLDGEILFRPDHGEAGRLYLMGQGRGEIMRIEGGGEGGMNMPAGAMRGLTPAQQAAIADAMRRAGRSGGASGMSGGASARAGGYVIAPTPLTIMLPLGEREILARAYEARRNDVLRWRVWTAAAGDIENGAEMLAAFRGFSDFLAQPAIPARMRDGLFIFDIDAFGGRVPVGYDRIRADGSVAEESRLTTVSCGELNPVWFEPTEEMWTYNRRAETSIVSCPAAD